MQTRHRIAVLFSLLAAVLVIAGCSSSSPKSDAPLPDATTLLKESQQTTAAQKSVHLQLNVTGTIKQLPIETLTGDLTNVPAVAAQGKASIIAFGQTFKDVDFVVADGNLYGALTPGSFTNFGPAADIYDVSKILNPDVGLANILATFTGAKAEGRETVNDVGTVKITGTVPANAVNGLANLGATGDVPATAWIREDGDHDLVQAKLDPSQGNSVQMTLSDWGKTVTVTKPAA
ncbi:lipoarabinomannan carrier protein LprG [Mycolicibacterium madagascariense]|uniref:Lipoarabinomannan carrier protein LprG n=1 Tax=Mycolicibacterium madagascariense TaxID=212765 RepID=A0A7I7XGH9_9MYCO|nr:LppX_LprAFG lipoprotein [Mycolicibacterium madagascariense]MCV7013231.1 LppX_LprAFG lipoprotein [Mycolicibacterium madagascariense]BBZ28281.1 lipoarabinomannan carrier protein LprG [Mycolicibacterium madagascariense]